MLVFRISFFPYFFQNVNFKYKIFVNVVAKALINNLFYILDKE